MGMQINTNMAANNAYRSLSNTQTDLSKSLEKLSSGLRINRAGDDAAGLAISEGLKSQIGGLSVAARNAQDGIGLVQTAEGGLNQAHSILQRLRDLGVQAANDTNNDQSRAAITTEATSLVKELGRIGESTNFNGRSLLSGAGSVNVQVGANSGDKISVDLSSASVKGIADSLLTAATAGTAYDFKAYGTDGKPTISAQTYTFESTSGATNPVTTAVSVDVTAVTSATPAEDLVKQLNGNANFASKFTATVSKNADGSSKGIVVKANDGGAMKTTGVSTDLNNGVDVPGTALTGLDFSSAVGAQNAIGVLDAKINYVSTARASLGATQNRLESAVQTINIAKENLTASNSRIRDTDMAEEMVKFTRNNILSQAGTAMLAQANQSNQGVLQLLR